MNKYQLLKYAIIGLTFTSRAASTAIFLKPELRTLAPCLEPAKQILIQGGNSLWSYELSKQTLSTVAFRETDNEWISIERSIK